MSADRMVGGASAQKNNAVPLRKNQRKSLENSCRNTKNRLANPGSGALPNHNRQESCASMGTTLVFNICEQHKQANSGVSCFGFAEGLQWHNSIIPAMHQSKLVYFLAPHEEGR